MQHLVDSIEVRSRGYDGLEGMRVLGERFRCGEFVLLEREGLVDFVLALLELVEAGEGRLADLVLGLGVGGVGFV